jgi:hydrogenase nickel incorporation protein HypA/HybF
MHELAIAHSLLEVILNQAEKHDAKKIKTIRLKIGDMAGVLVESLEMGFFISSQDTIAEGATIEVERVPLIVKCNHCGIEQRIKEYTFRCQKCFSDQVTIISGRELLIDSIDVDD